MTTLRPMQFGLASLFLLTAAVAVVCWVQPTWDVLTALLTPTVAILIVLLFVRKRPD